MKTLLMLLAMIAICSLFFWLRVRPFREKKTNEPERSAQAELLSRRIEPGTGQSGRSHMGYSFVLTFRLEENIQLELYAYEQEYGALREGMTGMLTWKGPYFVRFEAVQ